MVQVKVNHSVLGELKLDVQVQWREHQGVKLAEMVFCCMEGTPYEVGMPGSFFGGWDEEMGGGLDYDIEKDELGYLELEAKLFLAVIPHFPYFFSPRGREATWFQCELAWIEEMRKVDPRTDSDKSGEDYNCGHEDQPDCGCDMGGDCD